MKRSALVVHILVFAGLLTGCGSYPLGVPLGLTQAEINALPPAKRAAVLEVYHQSEVRDASLRMAGGQVDLASWRQTASRDATALESLSRTNDRVDTSPGAVR